MAAFDDMARQRVLNICREIEIPFFTENKELFNILCAQAKNEQELIYRCLLFKSENTSLSISGMSLADTSTYFKRMARMFKPSNSGVLQ